MDIVLVAFAAAALVFTIQVSILWRRTKRQQARLERQSQVILMLALQHKNLGLPPEPEKGKPPVLRLIQGGKI